MAKRNKEAEKLFDASEEMLLEQLLYCDDGDTAKQSQLIKNLRELEEARVCKKPAKPSLDPNKIVSSAANLVYLGAVALLDIHSPLVGAAARFLPKPRS